MRSTALGSFLAAWLAAIPAASQSPPLLVNASFTGTYDGTAAQLHLVVDDAYGSAAHDGVVNVDVVRVDMGTCANERPLARF